MRQRQARSSPGQPAYAAVEDWVEADRLPDFTLKGISKPVPAYSVIGLLEKLRVPQRFRVG